MERGRLSEFSDGGGHLERKPLKITVFYCINALDGRAIPSCAGNEADIQWVKMACSSMVKDILLMRSFESGSDGVVVLVCPEEACRYGEGSIRAKKRVEYVRGILEEIGLSQDRLRFHNTAISDDGTLEHVIRDARTGIAELGPNPLA